MPAEPLDVHRVHRVAREGDHAQRREGIARGERVEQDGDRVVALAEPREDRARDAVGEPIQLAVRERLGRTADRQAIGVDIHLPLEPTGDRLLDVAGPELDESPGRVTAALSEIGLRLGAHAS